MGMPLAPGALARHAARMPTLNRPDATIHYETAGEGPPLLMLAGAASDHASWGPVVQPLSRRFRLILPDARATGRSSRAPHRFEALADDAAALLDHLGVDRAHVCGHSLGGMGALDLATRFPARVGRLVLAATMPAGTPHSAAVFGGIVRARREGASEETFLRLFHPWLMGPDFFADPGRQAAAVAMALAYPHAQPREALEAQLKATVGLDLSDRPARVTQPALLLLGERDLLFPPAESRAAFAAIPGLRVETLEGAGHALHWDAPGPFAAAVTRFLLGG
jgi:pimeloyl-ACP methyl ester carboxylesterase